MKELYTMFLRTQQTLFDQLPTLLVRDLYSKIQRSSNRILIVGQRGVGKSTMLMQHCKQQKRAFYFSADHHAITSIGLYAFVDFLVFEMGETILYIDEIFRYPHREQEIKNCFDAFSHVQFILTGSNSLQAFSKTADFVRRADIYHLQGLSFAEYLQLKHVKLPRYSFDQIIQKSIDIRAIAQVRMTYFQEYLHCGFYPMISTMDATAVKARLFRVLDEIIIQDIGSVVDIHTSSLFSMKKLFYFIGTSTPSDLSITGLSQKLQVNRASLETVLHLLSHIGVLHMIPRFGNPSDIIRKEYKILLGNPMLYTLYQGDIGSMRESFFLAMVKPYYPDIFIPRQGDYVVRTNTTHYHVEIGGKSKTKKQLTARNTNILIQDVLVSDTGVPLWQFGLIA